MLAAVPARVELLGDFILAWVSEVLLCPEEFITCQSLLTDDRVLAEALAEDLRGVRHELRLGAFSPERRRGPDAAQVLVRRRQPVLEATYQAGEIGALGAIERVDLIDDQELEGLGVVVAPQVLVLRAKQQVVEHLVVREQDVWWVLAHRVTVCDELLAGHHHRGRVLLLADVETRCDLATRRSGVVDELGESPCLVSRQRVHRVDEDRFDAGGALLLDARVEDRQQEALGLTRASPGRDQRGLSRELAELLECSHLVGVRPPRHRDVAEVMPTVLGRPWPKRELERDVWPAHQRAGLVHEAVDHGVEPRDIRRE